MKSGGCTGDPRTLGTEVFFGMVIMVERKLEEGLQLLFSRNERRLEELELVDEIGVLSLRSELEWLGKEEVMELMVCEAFMDMMRVLGWLLGTEGKVSMTIDLDFLVGSDTSLDFLDSFFNSVSSFCLSFLCFSISVFKALQ